jgi:hypothetical protein
VSTGYRLLRSVSWPSVMRGLASQSLCTPMIAQAVADAVGPDGFDPHRLLGRLIECSEPLKVERAVWAAAPTLGEGEALLVSSWVRDAAVWYGRFVRLERNEGAPSEPRSRLQPVLEVDEELSDLPLLDLARDLAGEIGGLTIKGAALGDHTGHYDTATHTISIDLVRARSRYMRSRVLAHELGHALDPRFGEVSPAAEEMFAEGAVDVLLTHRPSTTAAARSLLEPLDRDRRIPVQDQHLPASQAASIFAFGVLVLVP